MFSKTFATFAALAAAANGHMLMNTPSPYSSPALVNGPLDAGGANFPCQLTSGASLSGGTTNTYALGSTQELKFTGSAVHGGGSCQVSITYDTAPSADSTWKVIHSIEGGCPAQDQTGNMGDNAAAVDPYTYNFTVPTDIPTGKVTLAWTWFNKIGNREMYMNCAPVELTGTSGTESAFTSLPDMFTANIGNGCGTQDSTDLLFPNPGDSVVRLNGATSAFATPTGSCQAASGSSGSSSAAASSAAASPTATYGSGSSSAAAGEATATGTLPGGVFATQSTGTSPATSAAASASSAPAATSAAADPTTSAAADPTTTAAADPTTSAAAASTPVVASGTTSAATTSSTASSGAAGTEQTAGSACTDEGAWVCLGSKYQQCASGTWSVVMALADGTTCSGSGSTFTITASNSKRRLRSRGRAVAFRA